MVGFLSLGVVGFEIFAAEEFLINIKDIFLPKKEKTLIKSRRRLFGDIAFMFLIPYEVNKDRNFRL